MSEKPEISELLDMTIPILVPIPPVVSWSRGLKQIKPSGSGDKNGQFGKFALKKGSVLSRIVLGLSSPLEIRSVAPQENSLFGHVINLLFPASLFGLPGLILLHEKFLQFNWLRAAVFPLNLKYLHVKITNLLWVLV